MAGEKKQYRITIGDTTYTLTSDESEKHINRATQRVQDLIMLFHEKQQRVDPKKGAIMAAVTLASDMIHLEDAQQDLIKRLDDLMQFCDQPNNQPD